MRLASNEELIERIVHLEKTNEQLESKNKALKHLISQLEGILKEPKHD
jgi:hypothetical protein